MNQYRSALLFFLLVALGACAGDPMCKKEGFYESSRLGERVVAPDDLDSPAASRELKIPEPSGRPPRAADAGCVDKPPSIWTGEE